MAEAFGGSRSGSGVQTGLTVFQSGIMKERINKSIMKMPSQKKRPLRSNKDTEESKGGPRGSSVRGW